MSFSHRTRIINTMNYLYYEFKTSQVCIVKENEKKYHNSMSINAYFNEKCLMNGASLKGRQEAFMYQMKLKVYSNHCFCSKTGNLFSKQVKKRSKLSMDQLCEYPTRFLL